MGAIRKLQVIVSAKKQTPVKCLSLPWLKDAKVKNIAWKCTGFISILWQKSSKIERLIKEIQLNVEKKPSVFHAQKEDAQKTAASILVSKLSLSRD